MPTPDDFKRWHDAVTLGDGRRLEVRYDGQHVEIRAGEASIRIPEGDTGRVLELLDRAYRWATASGAALSLARLKGTLQ